MPALSSPLASSAWAAGTRIVVRRQDNDLLYKQVSKMLRPMDVPRTLSFPFSLRERFSTSSRSHCTFSSASFRAASSCSFCSFSSCLHRSFSSWRRSHAAHSASCLFLAISSCLLSSLTSREASIGEWDGDRLDMVEMRKKKEQGATPVGANLL